ncbi:MAG TPA: RNA-guided pseudouridylation complex pseudouridine synthase subunit Cbf5, partial [Methanocella sp.]|nr:RNA-guided pseudouridylation complex pseudouridine synthase subunit Cbf5 [Methanocella sp.]
MSADDDRLPGAQKRERLGKSDCRPGGHGKDPYSRSVAELLDKGVINLDKPYGPTSHEVT